MVDLRRRRAPLLFLNVLIIATCGLVYELLAGAVASYLLGDSITQFSLVIGLYLSAMGLGAYLSRFLSGSLAKRFIEVELAVALLGGLSAPIFFLTFGLTNLFRLVLFLEVAVIGVLVGLELPLLMRILEKDLELKELVARVLAFDYLGALLASLLFPLLFVPQLGLLRTSLVIGLMNAGVGLWGTSLLKDYMGSTEQIGKTLLGLRARALFVMAILVVGLIKAESLSSLAEQSLFSDNVVFAKTTPYQRIVVTGHARGFALYLNGNLQLASHDEYRYHEALVHPALASVDAAARVLILGGGDGLALREVLKDERTKSVTLVDLDPGMTSLSRDFPPLAELNERAFEDPRVVVVNEDAFLWLEQRKGEAFDVAIVDFPDPNHFSLGKLYTKRFYTLLAHALTEHGVISVQATSPLLTRKSFWTIVTTIEAAGFHARPYHAMVPSFGEWGFVLAKKHAFDAPQRVRPGLRFLNDDTLASLFVFPPDMDRVDAPVNRLDNQLLVHIYEDEAAEWLR